jgi:hypothetical protein
MSYYEKYTKYKTKYIELKNNSMIGGDDKIKLTPDNTEIIQINDNPTLLSYSDLIIKLTKGCEPTDNYIPELIEGRDIYWLIKYKENNIIVGYLKSTDLNFFKDSSNFELLGGIREKKGLQISGACNGIPKEYSNLATLILTRIEDYAKENNYDYVLLHAGIDREYVIGDGDRKGLYIKNGYEKIRILRADEGGYDIDVWIMIKHLKNGLVGGGNKWCRLPKNAKLYFGSGGSDGIIAVLDDIAYKYFPVFIYPESSSAEIKNVINRNKYEIDVIKELTKLIIKPKLSPHIVEYYNTYKCNETPDNIFKNCPSYTEMLISKKKIDEKCNLIYNKGYPRKLYKPMYILEMEKEDGSLGGEIEKISKQKWDKIENFLNRLYFQIFYTLETIKSVYPKYVHNDLFIRNVMIKNTNYSNDEYIRYYYGKMIFDLPANGLYVKINDFGMNQLTSDLFKKNGIKDRIIDNPYRDYFSIIYDVYNGGNMGGKSLTTLIKNKDKIKKIDKYFNQFMDVKEIKRVIKNNNKKQLDWDWNKTLDKDVVKIFGLRNFDEYLKYFIIIFPYDKNHKIVEEYGK